MIEERALVDGPENSETLTDFDRRHLKVYVRILDAIDDEADWRDIAATVLNLDVDRDFEQAQRVYDAYAARARWMSDEGHRHLLESAKT